MRETFKQVLVSGGVISFPYKREAGQWITEIKIFPDPERGQYVIAHPWDGPLRFDDPDKAITAFLKAAIHKKNIALAYSGIRRHRLTRIDFGDLKEIALKELVGRYFAEFFEADYAEFLKETL